ncbi:hypothetical protein CHS0354_039061 [Potamilus streckersoni]|uniref:Uncharacterized protein n=1 Tax=Potamilus streckersoni TaxID=2493646 RepID=A0AAE0RRL7_9BIVA|nr:hypothetical protein CHS0354_039061 [Potamilus streckersoni]
MHTEGAYIICWETAMGNCIEIRNKQRIKLKRHGSEKHTQGIRGGHLTTGQQVRLTTSASRKDESPTFLNVRLHKWANSSGKPNLERGEGNKNNRHLKVKILTRRAKYIHGTAKLQDDADENVEEAWLRWKRINERKDMKVKKETEQPGDGKTSKRKRIMDKLHRSEEERRSERDQISTFLHFARQVSDMAEISVNYLQRQSTKGLE